MSLRKTLGGLVCGVALIAGLASSASAAEERGGPSYTDGMLRKLGRGIANIVTCPLEVLRTPTLVTRREGIISGWSIGIVEGLWRTGLRGVTGVFEVVTFYAEIPHGFAPLMKPEFVFEHGDWTE